MPILIGVDEAGYGPNLGPMVVAATAWKVEENAECGMRNAEGTKSKRAGASARLSSPQAPPPAHPDLYKLLRKTIARAPDARSRKLAIADSKTLYKAGLGVHQLERGVLAALAALNCKSETQCIARVAELLAATSADPHHRRRELDCHFDDDQSLPLEAAVEEVCRLAAKLRQTCADNGVTLLAIRATLIYPTEFNELVERFDTKGAALSHVTLGLVRRIVDEVASNAECRMGNGECGGHLDSAFRIPHSAFVISLDKHGGRNRYAALIQHHFPESWIETVDEARDASRYRWRHGGRPIEAVFRVGCEELLPTALASMTAKYHREVAMRAFNRFWTARLPDLRPTAGYPGDAHRFKADIATLQQELGIEDRVLWRCR